MRTEVTPEMAETWLGRNARNRNMKQRLVERYARDMKNGEWRYTGESIKFSESGRLLDGQHRLQAIILAETPITVEVVRDLPDEAQDFMDTGMKRTASDMLAIHGMTHTVMAAAAARLALGVEAGYGEPSHFTATHAEVRNWMAENPEISRSCSIAHQYAKRADCRPSVVAYSHYMMSRIDEEEADAFWAAAGTKAGLPEGDPILAMTWKFADIRRNNQRLRSGAYLSMIYRAWNARREGKTMQTMKLLSNVTGDRARIPALK
jgi:hypothetical protein